MNILVVDDVAANRLALRAIFENENFSVTEAADGLEALEVLAEGGIEAVISDILMPRMDGYRFCYEVRSNESLRHLPFVFYTAGYTSSKDRKQAFEVGADKFLIKPASATEILRALKEARTAARTSLNDLNETHELTFLKEHNTQLASKLAEKDNEVSRLDEELFQSEQRLLVQSIALETAANAVAITDRKGTILWVNPAFVTLTGYQAEEVIGKTPRVLKSGFHNREFYRDFWEAILAGKTWRGTFTNRRKNGEVYQDEHTITPVRSTGNEITHFIAIMTDVTERQQAENKLRQSEERLEMITQKMNEGLILADFDGKLLLWNPAALEMHGFAADGKPHRRLTDFENVFDFFDLEGTPLPQKEWPILRIFRGEPVHDLQLYIRRKGSEWEKIFRYNGAVVSDSSGNRMAFLTITDITDAKKAEAKITEQAALLDKARDAILVRDLEGHINFWNKGAEHVYGWSREEVLGKNAGALLYPQPERFTIYNQEVLKNGEWSGELQHLTKEGNTINIEARWTLIRDDSGSPKSILAINTDITERKKIEAQFMRAQRMESIGTLAGGVAHDLNNILTPIMMSIELLKMTSEDPEALKCLETISISAKRGADIVRQVLSFARGLEGERIEVHPSHLLKDLENIIRDTFPKNIRLHFSLLPETWTILGDPTQIHQILLNLCVNARDAMPGGGDLTVEMSNSELDQQYAAMNLQAKPGCYVKISATDTGTGIPAELIDQIFEPFFTTKELNKGTGLGLSTVIAIVKSHNGFVNVYSEPGEGTTFKIYLPKAEGVLEDRKGLLDIQNLSRGNGETILLVDDEASILTITGQTLQAFGYRIVSALDGAEAIAIYAQHRDKIAAVLTDMRMPIMDGPAMIHALMRLNPSIKIIAASGLTGNNGMARIAGAGVKHFLTKPYTASTLLKTIREVLDEPPTVPAASSLENTR